MENITKNTLVTISLRIESEQGTFLDESEELMYLHGAYGQIFQRLEEALEGKTVGDQFNVLLSPADAFGEYDPSLVVTESLEALPEETAVGMELEVDDEDNVWVVEKIEDGVATLNANHELAGIALRVSGEILELNQLSDEGAQEILEMDDDDH